MKWMKKWFVAMMLLCVGIGQAMAQKNIDKLAEELERRDDVAINSITKRDPKTRKITRVVKTFSLKDERMAKRLIEAFEKDEEYAVSAIKDMPKGRKSALRVNFTFIYQNDDAVIPALVRSGRTLSEARDYLLTGCWGLFTNCNDCRDDASYVNLLRAFEYSVHNLTDKMKEVNMKVTYHDPCHLGRGQGIKDQPREIIEQIPGVEFEEMLYPCQCCGAGGGIKSGRPEIAMELSKAKADMIKDTGADAVITICPFCQRNLQDGLNDINEENIKTMHILELLEKSYE